MSGVLKSCSDEGCNYFSRMPVIPYVLAILGNISPSERTIAIIKDLVLSGVLLAGYFGVSRLAGSAREAPVRKTFTAVLLLATLSAPILQRSSAIDYEEGYVIEVLVVWTIATLLSIDFLLGRYNRARQTAARHSEPSLHAITVSILLALGLVMTKMSFAASLLFSILLGLVALIGFRRKLIEVRSVLIALSAVSIVLGSWALWQQEELGATVMLTSYDGENAFRGANSTSLKLYPEVSLDRIMWGGGGR